MPVLLYIPAATPAILYPIFRKEDKNTFAVNVTLSVSVRETLSRHQPTKIILCGEIISPYSYMKLSYTTCVPGLFSYSAYVLLLATRKLPFVYDTRDLLSPLSPQNLLRRISSNLLQGFMVFLPMGRGESSYLEVTYSLSFTILYPGIQL